MKEALELIDLFLLCPPRNRWIEFEYGKVYLRKSTRYLNGEYQKCIDLAVISILPEYRRKGICTAIINRLLATGKIVYAECVNSELLREKFKDWQTQDNENYFKRMEKC